jgi:ribosomal protein L37AE/L43A
MCVEEDKEEGEERKGKREMLYCPNCGSPNVEWLLPQIWSKWVCRDCGYIGVLILEDSNIATELRKEWKERHKAP